MKTFFLAVVLVLPLFSWAQKLKSNSIKLHVDGFHVSDGGEGIPFSIAQGDHFNLGNQIGISYERMVFKDLFISVTYSKWVQWPQWSHPKHLRHKGGYTVSEPVGVPYTLEGTPPSQYYYFHQKVLSNVHMLDISAIYKLYVTRRQTLSAGIGASYFWGKRDNWYGNMWALGDVVHFDNITENAASLGIVPQISYDYLLIQNMLSIGVDTRPDIIPSV